MADYHEEVKEQYRVTYDQASGAFKILDMWADDIRNLPPDATVPDNTPAMKVVNSRELNALLGTVNKMGWIDKIFGPRGGVASNDSYYATRKSIQEVSIENITAIIQADKDAGVTREGILAIREIINKV